jgi:hypothetical protein
VESLLEMPGRRSARAIVIHVDRPSRPDDQRDIERAIQRHFARKARLVSRDLRDLMRRGWISLVIGLAFLALMLVASESVHARSGNAGALAFVLRESLLIGGWVAMWKPLEIFLYDWWPIVMKRRQFTALSRLPVELVGAGSQQAPSTHA